MKIPSRKATQIKGLLVMTFSLLACVNNSGRAIAPEHLYDNMSLTPITSSFNIKNQTLSILYGNAAAKNALAGNIHGPAEEYRLTTWNQESHYRWFGSNINGSIKSVETISTSLSIDSTLIITYTLLDADGLNSASSDEKSRTDYILTRKPSTFPQVPFGITSIQ